MSNRITFFPTPLPDEHIFSTVARWCVLHKHETLNNLLLLISNRHLTLNPSWAYSPFYKAIFDIFDGNFEPENFLRHTLIRFYQTFTDQDLSKAFSEGYDERIFPFQNFRMITARNWRWCRDCAVDDIETCGTTYWHLSHQLPTVIHCYKHSKKLIHGCTCGFVSDSFRTFKLPPTGNYCPQCKKAFDDNPIQNGIIHWLDTISLHLMNIESRCKISLIKNKLIENILPAEFKPKTVAYNRRKNRIQNDFDQFLRNNDIEEIFFINERELGPQSAISKIRKYIHSNEFHLPIFYLLLMKFFLDEDREIEHTLFGKEESEYDLSTKSCIGL